MTDNLQYVLANDTGVCLLDCTKAFDGLSDSEKLYTYYLSRASWYGGLIVLAQTSPESPGIFLLLHRLFKAESVGDLRKLAAERGFSDDEFQAFLMYAAGFYSNSGNYKAFGDTKFIPNVPKEKVEKLIFSSAACQSDMDGIKSLWQQVGDTIYSLTARRKELGLAPKGTTTYFSSNCDTNDAAIAQEFLTSKNLSAYNTRLFKTVAADTGSDTYEVKLASVEVDDGPIPGIDEANLLGMHQFTPKDAESPVTFRVSRGDYSKLLGLVCENLKKAKSHAANKEEEGMLEEYIKSFRTGSIPAHKDGSRHWIKDKGPIVESYIGFIESYRDPSGVRGEFEGFVAVVNKEMSAKFIELVNNSEHLLPLLPWPATYEKDTFLKPDFTSLDVVAFSGSGVPAGINIPNYDEIRQFEGFKNVSLGNVLSSGYKDTKITLLAEEDKDLYIKWKLGSFEVQVGLHELLGHGSGKLFMEDEDGKLNFDVDNVKNLITNEKVTNWYKHNETYFGRFTSTSPPYEECRAECVGLYLCLSADVLRIFGYTHNEADDVVYVNWLNMVRAGLMSLEFYSPENRAWGQAHMQARFAILRVMLEAGEEFVRVEKVTGEDGQPDLIVRMDRSKIISVGKPAIGNFLNKLQVYKTVGDAEGAKKMFNYYCDVNDNEEPHFLSLRETVLKRKLPRKMLVQHNAVLEGEKVFLREYEASAAGMVQSVVDRFPSSNIETILEEIWEKDRHHFIGLD